MMTAMYNNMPCSNKNKIDQMTRRVNTQKIIYLVFDIWQKGELQSLRDNLIRNKRRHPKLSILVFFILSWKPANLMLSSEYQGYP